MDLKDIATLIRDFGFPTFVASYLLLRVDKVLVAMLVHMRAEEIALHELGETLKDITRKP